MAVDIGEREADAAFDEVGRWEIRVHFHEGDTTRAKC